MDTPSLRTVYCFCLEFLDGFTTYYFIYWVSNYQKKNWIQIIHHLFFCMAMKFMYVE